MAKKGGAQQLQVEVNTDEELYKFLERPGLLVLDVYSEWCGPCLAMVGSLRKIKLELGGDNLSLAICKTDTIEALSRFRNKSEPTWLFATRGRLVNLMFGTNVPKLMSLIADELELLGSTDRDFYDITELQPEERARRDVIENKLAESQRKEAEEAAREKFEYLTHVTNEIMSNLPDVGVTIFGPHVHRDAYKKIMEIAESKKMQCKDRRTVPLLRENLDIINFACQNPIDPEILEHMYDKDVLICFWKVQQKENVEIEDIITSYANELTAPRKVVSDIGDQDEELPPILKPLEIKTAKKLRVIPVKEKPAVPKEDPLTELMNEIGLPGDEEGVVRDGNKENIEIVEEIANTVTSNEAQIILVPPIWAPSDARTHATLIYVFFRPQTATFLEPDPIPDPPHIIMAFEAYKKKDLFELIAKHKEDSLLYGFFTDDNPETAQLIANTVEKYEAKTPQITDKIVLKIAKRTSHTMLAFATFAPSFVSENVVAGKEQALKFFPEGYTNEETDQPEPAPTKKKKAADKTDTAGD